MIDVGIGVVDGIKYSVRLHRVSRLKGGLKIFQHFFFVIFIDVYMKIKSSGLLEIVFLTEPGKLPLRCASSYDD